MRILCVAFGIAMTFMAVCTGAGAQTALPDHRYVYSQDTDFYGADLGPLFDTTRAACVRACSAQPACVAFTFNTRSNACFPKSDVSQVQIYEGALSARKRLSSAAARDRAATRQSDLTFLQEADLDAAMALVQQNADRFPSGDLALNDAVLAMEAAIGRGDRVAAARWAGSAVALSDRGDLWAQLAWLGLRPPDGTPGALANRLHRESIPAAINAYLRSDDPDQQVTALDLMARAFEANGRGRDMIAPLRFASTLEPRAELLDALDDAIGKYGFRVTDTRVDNDSARPRICAEFSEKLSFISIDYAPFVRIADPGIVVTPTTREICLEGVTHGNRYTVTFRAGLPAATGETLHKDVTLKLYVRDRTPSVRFAGRAYVLPRSADAALPIETVNTDSVDLRLRRVSDRNLLRAMQDSYFGKPLSKYEDDAFADTIAEEIWTGTGQVQNTLNATMATRLPLREALEGQPPGIYALSASIKGQDPYDTPAATQWFILSNLGLSTMSGVDGLHVTVRRLDTAAPAQGTTVTLISRANAVLGTARTDADGFARFAPGLTRGTGAAAPALVMAADAEADAAFLSLTDPAFDLSDRGVEGHPPSPPIDTFLTTDRGAYRAGETIFATVLTRDATGRALADVPLTAVLKRPDGVEYSRTLSGNSIAGGHVFALPVGREVPRGAWRLDLVADPAAGPLASQTVLIEDFLPDRITFDATLPEAPLRLGDTPPLRIDARYLFGAPGADLGIEGEARLRATRTLDAHPGYLFGRYDQRFEVRTAYLDPARTDAQGQAMLPLVLPTLDEIPSQPLEAAVTLRVSEGSGRPVERRLTRPLSPEGPLIGIKPGFDGVLEQGANAPFTLIATEGTLPVRWTFNRVETRYQWYQSYGTWEWEPITRRVRVATGEATLTATPVPLDLPTDWGRYELVVEHTGQPYVVSSVDLSSGWYGGDGATDTPDVLSVSLDRTAYGVGDTARLRLVAPHDGVALISVLSNRVIDHRTLDVTEGENTVSLPVTGEWGSSAYVTATVLRPMDAAGGLNPARSLGLAHATVLPGDKRLDVTLAAPSEVDGQAGTLSVPVSVTGLAPGDTAHVTLAAVDVGILNLTDFQTPDPADHYFGQRRLGVGLRDVYGRLIDGLNGAMGSVRSGGDAAASAQLQSPPPTEKLMAFFSGPVTIGPDGTAQIEVDKPAFNGTIRLMAVAWSDRAVGSAVQEVIARDPVVLTASLPRLLAPGDDSRLLLELAHTRGPAGDMTLELRAGAGVALGAVPSTVTLPAQGTARAVVPLRGDVVGDHRITVALTTPDGTRIERRLELPVRLNDPEVATTRRFTLGAGETFTFDSAVLTGLRAGTGAATLTAGPLARIDLPGLLRQLDRYPYGCTEQVTSGALPLLYLSDMAEGAGLGAPDEIDAKIAAAIDRVLARQASNGAFGLWAATSGDFWLDAYVTDFLWRARTLGHAVPPQALAMAMDNLRNRINFAPDFDNGGEDIAYALLVLARAGAAQMGDLRYYADTKAQDFATPMAAAQLGAALAAYGDPTRADRLFGRAGALLVQGTDRAGWRDDYGSRLRDTAAVISLVAEADSTAVDVAALGQGLGLTARSLSTQEAAQVTLAGHALRHGGAMGGLLVDGMPATGTVIERLSDRAPGTTRIRNVGDTATDVTLTRYGVPEVAPAAGGYGYALTRRLFTTEGVAVDGPVPSGTRLVVVLEVQPFEDIGARLMIDDPLPGGWEIDNPNLLRSGDIKALDWLDPTDTRSAEFRADRFLAAVDQVDGGAIQLAYVVRAVTPGSYHHPAALVTDMYRPEYRANTATGRVTVTR